MTDTNTEEFPVCVLICIQLRIGLRAALNRLELVDWKRVSIQSRNPVVKFVY
jgi:hypothetical protein